MSLTALCIQSFPFALLRSSVLGGTQWGTKTKKNPGNNKNNADRQRFQGGFVKTDPPFDYLACANPAQTVKLSVFAHRKYGFQCLNDLSTE
ncbi:MULTISPECIES: hypothetical protein [Marinobacter]|uniref:hypothetical protein n=1 Tax=Marinobacter TaxID=2742 RepID=UPI00215D83B9|nr:hypothetical protein [Marinobacter pelagius]